MRLAISNIAWEASHDAEVYALLRERGVTGIEVAPTRLWPEWKGADARSAEAARRRLADEGFEVPAMQAIVFGRPDLQVFRPETHAAFLEHMKLVSDLAAAMGARVLVFGAPKNRRRGQIPMSRAMDAAVEFLRGVGDVCAARGVCLGWEHNPIEYGCDFVTNAADARELVDRVGSPGVGLHLDAAGLHLCGGDIAGTIRGIGPFVHYHASEPMLVPIAGGVVNHVAALAALGEVGYAGWVSIEMKSAEIDLVRRSVETVRAAM